MATYAEVTTGVVKIDLTNAAAGTHYTVPGGSRAKVVFVQIRMDALQTLTFGSGTVFGATDYDYPSVGLTVEISEYFSRELWLYAGDTIAHTGSGLAPKIECVIEEYAN